jgi:hypothetical protein
MKISYNTLDNTQKQFKLINGVYSIENDRLTKWMWTAQEFSGVVNNIEYITFSIMSNIKNKLIYEDTSIDLNTECLNVVKIKMSGKTNFKFKLELPYEVNNDSRSLGVMLVGIKVEEDVIL